MKKLSLILIICLISLSSKISYSQVNKSIVDTTKQWNIFRHNGFGTGAYTIINKIGEDTIVNNREYKKVYTFEYWGDTLMNDWTCNKLLREDSNILYLYFLNNSTSNNEIIIYNFNLNVGDQFNEPIIIGGDNWGEYMLFNAVVDSIDSIEINGSFLKRIMFDINTYNGESLPRFTWIEGIGSTQGFLESGYLMDAGNSYLLCVKHEEDYIYINTDTDCLVTYGLNDIKPNEQIKIYPTLFRDNININTTLQNYIINVYDVFGKITFVRTNISKNHSLDLSVLNNGVYLLIIKDGDNKILKIEKIIKTN